MPTTGHARRRPCFRDRSRLQQPNPNRRTTTQSRRVVALASEIGRGFSLDTPNPSTNRASAPGTRSLSLRQNARAAVACMGLLPTPSQIPGNIHHHDPLVPLEQQHQLQYLHALVMQQILPPMPHHELRQKHGYFAPGVVRPQASTHSPSAATDTVRYVALHALPVPARCGRTSRISRIITIVSQTPLRACLCSSESTCTTFTSSDISIPKRMAFSVILSHRAIGIIDDRLFEPRKPQRRGVRPFRFSRACSAASSISMMPDQSAEPGSSLPTRPPVNFATSIDDQRDACCHRARARSGTASSTDAALPASLSCNPVLHHARLRSA